MADRLITAIGAEGLVRVIGADTTDIVRKAVELHGMSPLATAALGRALTGGVLLSKHLKNDTDSLTLKFKGDGPLRSVIAVAKADATVRGYVDEPFEDLPIRDDGKIDVGAGIGKGQLTVIKDLGLKEPYVGTCELISGEIAEDLTYYLAVSEQIPSVVALGVRLAPDPEGVKPFIVQCAGGYILQLMPGAPDSLIDDLERQIRCLPSVTTLMDAGESIENIVEDILIGNGFELKETRPCSYKCTCSREKMEETLISIGRKDLQEIIDDKNGAELCCQYCNGRYFFTTEEMIELLDNADKK